jgi:hypothetical protein
MRRENVEMYLVALVVLEGEGDMMTLYIDKSQTHSSQWP